MTRYALKASSTHFLSNCVSLLVWVDEQMECFCTSQLLNDIIAQFPWNREGRQILNFDLSNEVYLVYCVMFQNIEIFYNCHGQDVIIIAI